LFVKLVHFVHFSTIIITYFALTLWVGLEEMHLAFKCHAALNYNIENNNSISSN